MTPGAKKTEPFLLFGFYEENGIPACITQAQGTDARERFYFPYLMQEIVNLRMNTGKGCQDPSIIQLAGLLSKFEAKRLYELNSQLLSVVDMLEECLDRFHLGELEFIGIEHAALNRSVTPLLHAGKNFNQFPSWQDAPPPSQGSICRSRWPAALFGSTHQYAEWLFSFDASQSSLWFSVDGKEKIFDFLGLPHLLMSYSEFYAMAKEAGQCLHFTSLRPVDFYGTKVIEAHFCSVRAETDLTGLGLTNPALQTLEKLPRELWGPATSYRTIRTNRLDSFYFSSALGQVALG